MTKKNKIKFKTSRISVELHNDFIKMAHVSSHKGRAVFQLVKKEFASKEPDDTFRDIADVFKTHKFSTQKILLNIPKHFVMTRVLRLPSTNEDELEKMVKIESVKQIPYSDEEIISSYKIIEKLKDGYSDVLLAVAQASTVNRFIKTLEGANLFVEKLALGSESLFNWYSMIKGGLKQRQENVALLNINLGYVDIDIIEGERLIFTRAFSYGAPEAYADKNIIDEIKHSIATYEKENKKSVDKILLSGAEDKARALEPLLQKELDIPLELIKQSEGVNIDKIIDADLNNTSFIELIGLCLKNKDISINLLPKNMIEANQLRFITENLSNTFILLICIALVFATLIGKKIFDKSRFLTQLNSRIKSMESKVIKAKRMKENIEIIKNTIQKKPLTIDIIAEIHKITPSGVAFNLLDYESDKSLILRGEAPSLDMIIKFITILENSECFEDVKVKYTAKRKTADKELTDFEIVCLLSKVK